MLLLTTMAHAVEVTRPPAPVETEPTVVVSPDARPWQLDKQSERAGRQRRERTRLTMMDLAVRGQAQAMAGCPAGQVRARVRVSIDGRAHVTPERGAPEALAACLERAFERVPLPVLVREPLALTYTFRVAADEVAPHPVDRELGWLGVPFGARPADVPGLTPVDDSPGTTTLYGRPTDRGRLFGEDPEGVAYAFGDEEGFYGAMARFEGFASRFGIQEALTARYGPPRVDPTTQAPYWRGEHVVVQLQSDSDVAMLVVMDIDRARAGGHVERFPGDPK